MRTDGKRSVSESIADRIKREISLGVIAEGERLPSCRDLAMEMGVNPNTVQRAYSMLEEEGILFTIPKKGVYARGGKEDPDSVARRALLSLKEGGFSRARLESILDEIYAEDDHD